MERGRLFGFLLFYFVIAGLMLLAINGFDSSRKSVLFQIGDLIFLAICICLVLFAPPLSIPPRPKLRSSVRKWWVELGKKIITWNIYLYTHLFLVYWLIMFIGPFLFTILVFALTRDSFFAQFMSIVLLLDITFNPFMFFLAVFYGILTLNSYRGYVHQGLIPSVRSK